MYKFVMPEVIFGSGSIQQAGESCARLGAKRALIVTDEGVIQAGWSELVEKSCRQAGLSSFLFSKEHAKLKFIFLSLILRKEAAFSAD
ncbi:hypothetical protein AC623_16465 [Bacillus sp. FJAT-27231]|uniref:iron-containing alcohol dehydrogenase n=1 Tax=Bacillus sp. FJAT-27231 TaxID=1679168 RepID=UPI000670860E|nr:hypothetical protein AC623_16465 [Bacillus sp. FJAT-27231]